jgi:processive 1,2-diacylglycerol beta-glucosyltransferase
MDKNKILILHGQPGMGHSIPASAISEVFSKKYPQVQVKVVDSFDLCYKFFRFGYPFLYNLVVSKFPIIYKMCYAGYEYKVFYGFLEKLALLFVNKSKFLSFTKDFSPDFILATNPLPLQLVSFFEEKKFIDIKSANVCTDFVFHPMWHSQDINYYFIANEEMKKSFINFNVDPEQIKITGIPVRSKFNQPLDRKKIIAELGFDPSHPVLLIVGGYLAYKKLLKVVMGIKNKNAQVQFIIVAGRDKNLYKILQKSVLKNDSSSKIFGLVKNMEDFMAVADLVLSKAGGSTVAECLVMGLPMIINKIIPGNEEGNAQYLFDNGAGLKAIGVEQIVETVVDLFSRPEKLAKMKECCKKVAKPNASEEIVDFVVSQI